MEPYFCCDFFLNIKIDGMKRTVKLTLIFVCLSGAACFSFHNLPQAELQARDFALENVEALADGEGNGNVLCFGHGSIDCNGAKVEWKITGYGIGF
jgi:hypothetical protein